MLEIIKYGTSQYGRVWIIGNLKYQEIEILDLFNTNLTDENVLKDKTNIKPKKFKISRSSKTGKINFTLEF